MCFCFYEVISCCCSLLKFFLKKSIFCLFLKICCFKKFTTNHGLQKLLEAIAEILAMVLQKEGKTET